MKTVPHCGVFKTASSFSNRGLLFCLVFFSSFLWMLFWSRGRADPVLFYDETWLMYKAYLLNHLGHWFAPPNVPDVETEYAPLYSVISSLVFCGRDPIGAYSSVLHLNAMLLAFGAATLVFLPRSLMPARWSAFCALCVGLSPGYAGYASLAMSEDLFLPLFLILAVLLLCHVKRSTLLSGLLSLIIAALCLLTRKLGVSILLSVPTIFAVCRWSRRHRFILPLLSFAASFAVLLLVWEFVGDLSSHSGSNQTISTYVTGILLNWRQLISPLPIFGQIAYINIASGFLLVPSILWLVKPDEDGTRRPWRVLLFVMVPFLLPGILHMYIHPGMNVPDTRYLMYGRYEDPVIPYIIVTGFFGLFQNSHSSRTQKEGLGRVLVGVATMTIFSAMACPKHIAGLHVINIGAGWVSFADRVLRPIGGRWIAMATLGTILVVAISSRHLWPKWTFAVTSIIIGSISLAIQRNTQFSLVKDNMFTIQNLMEARQKGFVVAKYESGINPQIRSRARFYLADKYLGSLPKDCSIAPTALLHRSGAIVPIDKRISFDFMMAKDSAVFVSMGNKGTPWGRTAVLLNDTPNGPGIVLTMPKSSVRFESVPVPKEGGGLSALVGYYPQAKEWNVSDGVDCSILISNESGREIGWTRRLSPEDDPLPVFIPLDEFKDSNISVEFRIDETSGNQSGDWVFFGQPVVRRFMTDVAED